jgi:addiction module RelB/DinJ family antitoxin
MMKNTYIRARVDAKTKAKAGKVLAMQSLTISEAIRHFLGEIARQKKMPLRFAKEPRVVSGRTLWRMKRASQARDRSLAVRRKFARGQNTLISPKLARWRGSGGRPRGSTID